MAFNTKTASILAGGALGAYTSDITDDPLSGLISTGIGATMGGFMKVPSFSVREMSKVTIGPSVDMSLIDGAQSPSAFSTQELRTNLLNGIERDQKYFNKLQGDLTDRTSSFDEKISSLIQGRNNKLDKLNKDKDFLNTKIERSLNWVSDQLTKSSLNYDKRISGLEQAIARSNAAFEASRERIYSREVKKGSTKNHRRVPYYMQDKNFSGLLDKWILAQPSNDRDDYIKAGRNSATERIAGQQDYYDQLAVQRRNKKLELSASTMKREQAKFEALGIFIDGQGRAKVDPSFKQFPDPARNMERYESVDSYNRAKWLDNRISSDMTGAVNYEKGRIFNNITEGFVRYHAVTDFVSDPTSGLNLKKLSKTELDQISKSIDIRDHLVERIGGYSSLTAQDYQSQLDALKSGKEAHLKNLEENYKKSHPKVLRDNFIHALRRGEVEQQIHELTTNHKADLTELTNTRDAVLSKIEDKIKANQSSNTGMLEYLNSQGIKIDDVDDLKRYIASVTDVNILTKLNQAAKGTLVDLRKVKGLQIEETSTLVKAGNDQIEKVANYLEQVLGNSPELAKEKAEMFAARAKGSITLKDGSISFLDSTTGKTIGMPLTSYSGESRFHYAGNGNYQTVSQFNPYGNYLGTTKKANIDGVLREVKAQELLVGQDPEMMLKYLPENTPISTILPNIRSLFHYDSLESGKSVNSLGMDFDPNKTQSFVNSQGIVNLGYTLNTNEYGEVDPIRPFKKLNIMSNNGEISERTKMFNELSAELGEGAAGLADGLSLNSLTEVQTKGFASIAMLGPNERNETGVGNRGYDLVQRNSETQALADLYGEERFGRQFASSQALTKIDVKDGELFNQISSILNGNDKVLSDGAGFFKLGTQDLSVKDKAILKIPLVEAGIHNEQLIAALQSGDVSKYLSENNISIGNEVLASLKDRNVSLNSMYTSGTITGGYLTKNELRLQVDAVFDPNEEANVKLFSAGTKSLNTGIAGTQFEHMTGLAKLINEGKVVKQGNDFFLEGNKLDLNSKEGRDQFRRSLHGNRLSGIQMIGNASDTGMGKIMSAMDKGLVGDGVYDKLIKTKSQEISALTAMTFGEHKAAVDLMATIGIAHKTKSNSLFNKAIESTKLTGGILDINSQMYKDLVSSGFLNTQGPLTATDLLRSQRQADSKFTSIFNTQNYLRSTDKVTHLIQAADILEKLGIASSLKNGQGFAIGSLNKGMSIVGAGNRARMSWNAVSNLKASGMTDEQFDMFGKRNFGLLYEVRSTINERRVSNSAINNSIKGSEARFMSVINSNISPEQRLETFEKFFGKSNIIANNPYLTYNLTDPSSEIKSINFSRITTNRSGFYEKDDGVALIKDLDKKKLDLMYADLEYKNALNKEDQKAKKILLDNVTKEYLDYTNKMYSGDNNLAKRALALESEHSDIMQVKGIGGEAEKYSDKAYSEKRHVWFISEEEAEHKLNQMNKKLVYQDDTGFNGLKRAGYNGEDGKFIPLSSILTREPAQGPMSSDLVEWIVDERLQGRGNAYVANNLQYYSKGMFGDMDQDTVQTLTGDFKTSNQFEELNTQRSKVRSAFQDMTELLDKVKLKGNKDDRMKSLDDFGSVGEYAEYRLASAKKGRLRKELAAPATSLAVAYSKAMELELGSGKEDRLLQGRMLSHQLVENLIKSSHLNTEDFVSSRTQAVEELTNARKNYIGKGKSPIAKDEYEKVLRTHLPSYLNINTLQEKSVEGIKGRSIMEDIITSELNHSVKVGNDVMNPMDLAEHRNKTTFSQHLAEMFKSSGVESDIGDFTETVRTSSGRVATGMSDIIKDTIKNNKGVLLGGFAAMAGVAILGRDSPNFSDSRENVRQHSSKMLRAPGTMDEPSVNNTPMGMATNTIKTNYITPKSFNSKNMQIQGDFIEEGIQTYNEYSSLLEPDNIQDQVYNMTNAAFGNGVRSSRLQTN